MQSKQQQMKPLHMVCEQIIPWETKTNRIMIAPKRAWAKW